MQNLIQKSLFLIGIFSTKCLSQQYGGGGDPRGGGGGDLGQYKYPTPPPPQILSHKQALNHDGAFKYLFTADNGLAQGETIAPDGSRIGGYQYVDPHGKKISIKYTAGKEGFKILEGAHLPKAPLPIPVAPQQPQQQQSYNYGHPQQQQDDGQYRAELYERPAPAAPQYYRPQVVQAQPAARPYYNQQLSAQSGNAIEDRDLKEPEYNDPPGKANSFGTGYIFDFAG